MYSTNSRKCYNRLMLKKLYNPKATIFAFILALTLCLFLGLFANAPANMNDSFKGTHWYYINRGDPQAWAGVALNKSGVDFPIIKLPFLSMGYERTKFVKIIDLRVFIPTFIAAFILTYIPALIFAKMVDRYKKLLPIYVVLNIITFIVAIYIYFSWFPRI